VFEIVPGTFKLSIRTKDGTIHENIRFASPGSPSTKEWTYVSGGISASDLSEGDLVGIEETQSQSFDIIITDIEPDEGETARLTGIPANVADVLASDSDTPPAYNPQITPPRDEFVRGPVEPVVIGAKSDGSTATLTSDGRSFPRIAVELANLLGQEVPGNFLQLRWRNDLEETWVYGEQRPIAERVLLTGTLENEDTYTVEVRSIGDRGASRGWVTAATSLLADAPAVVPLVPVYNAADTSTGSDILNIVDGKQVTVRWENLTEDQGFAVFPVKETEVWRSGSASLSLDSDREPTNAFIIGTSTGSGFIDTSLDYATSHYYFLRAVGHNGVKSAFCPGRLVNTGTATDVPLVRIFTDGQLVEYNTVGQSPAPATIDVSTQTSGITQPYFDFLVNGVSQQNTTQSTFAYTPPSDDSAMPDIVRVEVRAGASTGPVLVSDQLSIDSYRQASSTAIMQLTNEAHSIPTAANGSNPDLSGASTSVLITLGGIPDTTNWSIQRHNTNVTSSLNSTTVTINNIYADVGYVDITATRAGYPTLTRRFTVTRVKAGNAGSPGAPGTAGSDGISHTISPASVSLPANPAGGVTSHAKSGCDIHLYEGSTLLSFETSNLTPGSWIITGTSSSPSNSISVGNISDIGMAARVADHSSMSQGTDVVTINYNITYKRLDGSNGTLTVSQSIGKSREGNTGATGATGPMGPQGPTGPQGVNGDTGESVAQLTIYQRFASPPTTAINSAGSKYDFSLKLLTPPGNWSATPPTTGSDPIYTSVATASVLPPDFEDTNLTWSFPALLTKDGIDGRSTYQAAVFKRASSPYPLPTANRAKFHFGQNALTRLDNGWQESQPAAGTDPVWVTRYLFSIQGDTGEDTVTTWSLPVEFVKDGVDGTDGTSTYHATIYRRYRAASPPPEAPPRPFGGSYDFGLNQLSAPNDWSTDIPAHTSDPLWICTALASTTGTTGFHQFGNSWSTPEKLSQDGAQGDTGNTRISGQVYYQTLQQNAPSSPSSSGITDFNTSTGRFTGLPVTWDEDPIGIDITNTSLKAWTSTYIVELTPAGAFVSVSFAPPVGAIQITDNIQSDNFDGVITSQGIIQDPGANGWALTRKGGQLAASFAHFRDKISTSQMCIDDTVTFDTNSDGELVIRDGGLLPNNFGSLSIGSSGETTGVGFSQSLRRILKTNHGLSNGDVIVFTKLGVQSNIKVGQPYWVRNRQTSMFEISETDGGPRFNLTGWDTVNFRTRYTQLTGVHINTEFWQDQIRIFQDNNNEYGLYVENNSSGGGSAHILSNGGYTLQVTQTQSASGFCGIHAANAASGGGVAQAALSSSDGGFAFNAVSGGYYDGSGVGYNPFTGAHEGLICPDNSIEPGDIVCDEFIVSRKISDSITKIRISDRSNDPSAVGVFVKSSRFSHVPAALKDSEILTRQSLQELQDIYELAHFNSLGEGCINVCGEGGDIARGDLIVTSSVAGKGMRQPDDVLRAFSVARAREDVTFSDPEEIHQIACIYLCG
jgi:hypothetical protein